MQKKSIRQAYKKTKKPLSFSKIEVKTKKLKRYLIKHSSQAACVFISNGNLISSPVGEGRRDLVDDFNFRERAFFSAKKKSFVMNVSKKENQISVVESWFFAHK